MSGGGGGGGGVCLDTETAARSGCLQHLSCICSSIFLENLPWSDPALEVDDCQKV
jgi:hypothetical protein